MRTGEVPRTSASLPRRETAHYIGRTLLSSDSWPGGQPFVCRAVSALVAGEGMVRVYQGTGKVLMSPFMYYPARLLNAVSLVGTAE